MNYSDSDMSKSTHTVVYFDWKTVIYIYACGQCCTQFMLQLQKHRPVTDIIGRIYNNIAGGIIVQM
jgi:hypothetical protein